MKIGAYQFSVTNSIALNMKHIQKAILARFKQHQRFYVTDPATFCTNL